MDDLASRREQERLQEYMNPYVPITPANSGVICLGVADRCCGWQLQQNMLLGYYRILGPDELSLAQGSRRAFRSFLRSY